MNMQDIAIGQEYAYLFFKYRHQVARVKVLEKDLDNNDVQIEFINSSRYGDICRVGPNELRCTWMQYTELLEQNRITQKKLSDLKVKFGDWLDHHGVSRDCIQQLDQQSITITLNVDEATLLATNL